MTRTPSTRPRALPSSLRALAHRDYRLWAVGGLFSVVGTWMQVAAQAWLLLELSGSGAVLGAGVALSALPALVLGPWGGVIADRFPRRRVLAVTQVVLAGLAGAQGLAACVGVLSPALLLGFSFAAGLVLVVESPAAGALGAALVPPEDLANASALGSAANSLGRIAGMSASGVVIALAGPGLAFLVNAASFLPVVVVLWMLEAPEPAQAAGASRPWRSLREGFAFIHATRHLAWLLGLAFVLGALGRSYQVTMALMVDEVLGGGAGGYATASTAFAVGALGGAVIAAHLRQATAGVVLAAAAAGTVGQFAAGLAPSMLAFVVVIVGVAAAAVVLDTAVSTRVAVLAPDLLRGRVLAVLAAAGSGAGAVGGPVLGVLGESLGARAALLLGAAGCVVALAATRDRLAPDRPVRTGVGPSAPARARRHLVPAAAHLSRAARVRHAGLALRRRTFERHHRRPATSPDHPAGSALTRTS